MKKRKIVLDSSVIVKFIFSEGEDNLKQADALLGNVKDGYLSLLAPTLSKYEVGNVIRFKKISEAEKMACWSNFEQLPIKFVDLNLSDGDQVQTMAEVTNITFYDAVFVVLAKKLGVLLVTANPKHQKNFGGVKVVALKDYK